MQTIRTELESMRRTNHGMNESQWYASCFKWSVAIFAVFIASVVVILMMRDVQRNNDIAGIGSDVVCREARR